MKTWNIKRNNMTLEIDFKNINDDVEQLNKNIQLIVAAPEMLETLEKLHDFLSYEPELQDSIYEVIKKAKGN